MAMKLNIAEIARSIKAEEILKKRVRRLVQACLENPELNIHVIEMFLQRKIQWDTISRYVYHGKPVTCMLCKEQSISGFWCKPCIHPDWCCYCCILLCFFRYS